MRSRFWNSFNAFELLYYSWIWKTGLKLELIHSLLTESQTGTGFYFFIFAEKRLRISNMRRNKVIDKGHVMIGKPAKRENTPSRPVYSSTALSLKETFRSYLPHYKVWENECFNSFKAARAEWRSSCTCCWLRGTNKTDGCFRSCHR